LKWSTSEVVDIAFERLWRMEQVRTLLDMGGYGEFVWTAFALTAAVMVGLFVATLRRLRARERALEHLQKRTAAQSPHAQAVPRRTLAR
jgi:heme exporter protein D